MRRFFPNMAHPQNPSFFNFTPSSSFVSSSKRKKRRMKTGKYWVYITEDSESGITIGFSTEMDKTLFELSMRGATLSYLCSFSIPFDALAHKHLLEDLSPRTIRRFMRSHREETKRRCDKLLSTSKYREANIIN